MHGPVNGKAVLLFGTLLVKEAALRVEIHHTALAGLHLGVKMQNYLVLRFNWSWYSVIIIVARLRAGGFEVGVPSGSRTFSPKRQDPLWGRPNHLVSVYWGLFS